VVGHLPYVTVSPASVSGPAGTTQTVQLTCYDWNIDTNSYDASDCTPSSTSSNGTVATSTGNVVNLIGPGTATITYTYTRSATLTVTVTAASTPTPAPTPTPVPTPTPGPTPCPAGWTGIPPNCVSPTPTPQPTTTPAPPLSASTTGINPWWTYEEGNIAGAGHWMINVATGNLVVQDDDFDIHERGIDLAFRRTYNSQSLYTYANDDGSGTDNYGNGWTSTFDAHMSYNAMSGDLSVWDIDGARYDYCPGTGGTWVSCTAGMHNTLTYDGTCNYQWTKKSGTVYQFYSPLGCAGDGAALSGRVNYIFARNHNNYIQFLYAFSGGDASSANNLTQIVAQHQDGHALTLNFADFAGRRLLASMSRPDGEAVTYQYDTSGNLVDVYEIGNDQASRATPIHHQYGWNANHQMAFANSPNWVANVAQRPGSYDAFAYDANDRVTQVQYDGLVNYTPNDGTGYALQTGMLQTPGVYRNETLTYTAGQTTYTDTDHHSTIYTYDTAGRETTRQTYTGSAYLVTSETWDVDNNLTSTVDPRGAATGNTIAYETDYQYDTSGDTVAMALPATATSAGTIRPTNLYSYDQYHNITSACDAVFDNANGLNWTSRPAASDGLCPFALGATRYQYDYSDPSEPYGILTTAKSPCFNSSNCSHAGAKVVYAYAASAQGGDYGLPSDVTPACFTQYDGSQLCPHKQFVYDSYGNLTSYNPGNGAWTLTYDAFNRPTAASDADNVTSYKCYNDDGSLRATQTPVQHTADNNVICGSNSVAYTYDLDGNKLTELHHHQNTPGTTTNWYDGDDRLVEVLLPHDSTDYYPYNWMTRNVYDLSQGQSLSANGAGGIYGSGNLYETQEWQGSWTVLKADSFDPMDRNVAHYQWQTGTSNFTHDSKGYDQVNTVAGFLSSKTDALGEIAYYNYDVSGHRTQISYANDGGVTPAETTTYDPDGRAATVQSSTIGTQTSTFDLDGFVRTVQEPGGGGVTSAATYTYDYYPGGARKSLSVASTSLTQSNMLQYAYREDGLRTKLAFVDGATAGTMTWGRKASGRVQTITDTSGQAAHTITYNFEGMVSQDQMASGTISGFTWDNESEITGFTDPAGMAATISYTVRGELRQQYFGPSCTSPTINPPANPEYGSISEKSANGYMKADDCQSGAPSTQWDPHTGAGLGNDTSSYSYDAAGRQTSTLVNWTRTTQCGDETCTRSGQDTYTKSYDAENHLLGDVAGGGGGAFDNSSMALRGCLLSYQSEKQTYDPPSSGGPYVWGPNGHPAIISGFVVHWDGDTPLFVTDAAGAVKEVKIETAAYYAPGSPLKYLDRNQSGFVVAAHWSGGKTPYTPADSMHQTCDSQDFSGAVLYEPGIDGLSDGVNIIQGVRAYNPITGQWSSPDAYAGNIHDPMSQKSFMWNGNNPYSFVDPSGFMQFNGLNFDFARTGLVRPPPNTPICIRQGKKGNMESKLSYALGYTGAAIGGGGGGLAGGAVGGALGGPPGAAAGAGAVGSAGGAAGYDAGRQLGGSLATDCTAWFVTSNFAPGVGLDGVGAEATYEGSDPNANKPQPTWFSGDNIAPMTVPNQAVG